MLASRVQPGVVLTTVMEHEVSSATSKVGDVFALRLDDGYARNGLQIIPIGSRIICSVTSVTPARNLRGGLAGYMQVSLQMLVLPDGQHVPIYGFIDSNPNHAFKEAATERYSGSDVRDYGQQVSAMMQSYTSGLGTTMAKRYRGLDFVLEKGELVPVRLNRTLVLPESVVQPQTVQNLQSAPTQAAPEAQAPPPPATTPAAATTPPAVSSNSPTPGLVDTNMPPPAPPRVAQKPQSRKKGKKGAGEPASAAPSIGNTNNTATGIQNGVSPAQSAVSGSRTPGASANSGAAGALGNAQAPVGMVPPQPNTTTSEPDVFQQPVNLSGPQSINDIPDPF